MLCINLESYDPYFNLALEEYLLKNTEEEYIILGINDPSVIIGKHQTVHREVNTKFITKNNLPVVRRISGGGTVFHDRGNLNFCFISQSEAGKQIDFRKYTQPVIDFLGSLGVEANFAGKSDLKVDNSKISGNAEHVFGNRVLHHGTLLFSTSMEMLRNSLRKDMSCYESRAISSNPSTVRNLNEKLPRFSNVDEFRSAMMNFLLSRYSNAKSYTPSGNEISQAESLALSKYRTWDWNWAYGPEYTFRNIFKKDNRLHSCVMVIRDGIIRECVVDGSEELQHISKKIIGCRHMVSELSEVFHNENIFLSEEDIFNFF